MIKLTEQAATKVKELIGLRDKETKGLRIGVKGGGCSGFSYYIEFINSSEKDDKIIECLGVKLFVDKKSYLYLMGTEISYSEGLMESGFSFSNPNARRTCGCGESFSV